MQIASQAATPLLSPAQRAGVAREDAPPPSAPDQGSNGSDGSGGGDSSALDFSTLDSASKAALLPALQGAELAVMMATLKAEATWNVAVTSLQDTTYNSGTASELTTQGTSNQGSEVTLTGDGHLGDVPLNETWTLHKDNGIMTVEGSVGDAHEALVLHPGDDDTQVLEGSVGDVAVHEVLRQTDKGLTIDGTLNGTEHHQVLTINQNAMPLRAPQVIRQVITVEGSLGDAPIQMKVDAICPEHVSAVTYEEHGIIAGTQVDARHTLDIIGLPSKAI